MGRMSCTPHFCSMHAKRSIFFSPKKYFSAWFGLSLFFVYHYCFYRRWCVFYHHIEWCINTSIMFIMITLYHSCFIPLLILIVAFSCRVVYLFFYHHRYCLWLSYNGFVSQHTCFVLWSLYCYRYDFKCELYHHAVKLLLHRSSYLYYFDCWSYHLICLILFIHFKYLSLFLNGLHHQFYSYY